MAGQNVLVIALVAALIPMATLAKEFIVGDDGGWITKVDYISWAKKQDFQVGDTLVFKYSQGAHNVIKVDENGYKNCIVPKGPALASGKDVISLDAPGKKWFICGIEKHCEKGGQKLEIEVKPAAPGRKDTSPPPKASTPAPSAANKTSNASASASAPSQAPTPSSSSSSSSSSSDTAPAPAPATATAPAPAPEAQSSANELLPSLAIMAAMAALPIF